MFSHSQLISARTVSHEWLSLGHADPQGEQLRELQRLLIRMMKGEVNALQPKVTKTLNKRSTDEATREEWAASLPFSFIWLDFLSIPQVSSFTPLHMISDNSCIQILAVHGHCRRFSQRFSSS